MLLNELVYHVPEFYCLQMLARPYRPVGVKGKRNVSPASSEGEAEEELFFLSEPYLRGCFWRAWWTVGCVADISSSSLQELVSRICLSYPEKLEKQKKNI